MAPRFRPVALRPRLSTGLPCTLSKQLLGTVSTGFRARARTLRSNFNMPNRLTRNKRTSRRARATDHSNSLPRPDSVKDLLASRMPALTRVSDQSARQQFWGRILAAELGAPLAAHICAVVEREHTLVVFAQSAAWSARLRFALQEAHASIVAHRPTIQHVQVRVLPRER